MDEMGFRGQLHGGNPELLMSALGQKRTLDNVASMSALPPKADIGTRLVRFSATAPAAWRHSPQSCALHSFVCNLSPRDPALTVARSN